MKSVTSHLFTTTALTQAGLAIAGMVFSHAADALPQNGQVVGGAATITQASPTQLTINQSSGNAVIDWRSFSIGANETTTFKQPNSSSVAVNRITGVDPSTISGHLNANGQVVLVNPNGILFDRGASVNVGGLVATTTGISTQNAMAGNYVFDQASGSAHATVVNRGKITAAQGGMVALVAPGVANSGVITAKLGKVTLASGNKYTLDFYGDNLINFAVDGKVTQDVSGPDNTHAGVSNSGRIIANAGTVEITADVAQNVVSNAINMSGIIEAHSVDQEGGTIILGGADSDVSIAITGKLDASGTTGGTVKIAGNNITQNGTIVANGSTGKGGTVSIDAASAYNSNASHISISGLTGGGGLSLKAGNSINITGGAINADATGNGTGGSVLIVSQGDTSFAGTISAKGGTAGGNGGAVETSGHTLAFDNLTVDTTAAMGKTGTWLLDPYDLTINSADGTAIGNSLATTNVTLQTTAANTGTSGFGTVTDNANGDIFVDGGISWNSANSLVLSAYRNISVAASITDTGAGNVILRADNTGDSTGTVSISGLVSVGGAASLYYDPSSYTAPTSYAANTFHGGASTNAYMLVNTAAELGSVSGNSAGTYALGNNITSIGALAPIGTSATPFSGIFDGNGGIATYTLGGLAIAGTTDVGLFGVNTGTIRNLTVTDGTVAGTSNVGGIAGYNNGTITNVEFDGTVTGLANAQNVGGVVGQNGFYSNPSLTNATFGATGSVTAGIGSQNVGGIAGINYGTITNGLSEGYVSAGNGSTNIGGLVGSGYLGLINGGAATGSVIAGSSSQNVGGFAGRLQGSLSGAPSFSGYLSAASGSSNIGGIVGFDYGVDLTGAASSAGIFVDDNVHNVGGIGGFMLSNNNVNDSFSGLILAGNGASAVGGLFGILNNSNLTNGNSSGGIIAGSAAQSVGGLVGYADQLGTISGGTASGLVLAGDGSNWVGGVIGTNLRTMTNVVAADYVSVGSGVQNVGGLAGYNESSGVIVGGTATTASTVVGGDGDFYVGGLVGRNEAKVINGVADNAVSVTNAGMGIGGLVGYNIGTVSGGSVTSNVLVGDNTSYVGGGVGWNDGGGTVAGLATSVYVSAGSAATAIGGIVGLNGSDPRNATAGAFTSGALVTGSSFVGNVSADVDSFAVGGIVGWNAASPLHRITTNPLEYGTVTGNTGNGNVTAGTGSFQVRTANQTGCDQANGCKGTAGTDVLMVTATGSATKVYGSADPTTYGYTLSGIVQGDTTAEAISGAVTRVAGENVGNYAITEGSLTPNVFNYTIDYTAGNLAITPAPLTITANNTSKTAGAANPAFSATFSGLVNGDTSSAITGLNYATAANTNSAAGTYTVTPDDANDPNYKYTYHPGFLTVTGGNAATGGITPVPGTGSGTTPTATSTVIDVTLTVANVATATAQRAALTGALNFGQLSSFGAFSSASGSVTCLTRREHPTDVCQVPLTIQGF